MNRVNSITWHENNLKNNKKYLLMREKELEDLTAYVLRMRNDVTELEAQIERAKREGRESFDADKYNKGRNKKG